MTKRNRQDGQQSKRLRLQPADAAPIQINHQWGDGEIVPASLIDADGGLSAAAKERGLSFIRAAKLIIEHEETDIHFDSLNPIEQAWMNQEGDYSKKDVLNLQNTLISELNENLYQGEKPHKVLLKELCNAENHINWVQRQTLTSSVESNDSTLVRQEQPLTAFNQKLKEEWLKILDDNPPHWFEVLPRWEQSYLTGKVDAWLAMPQKPNLGDYLGSVPTTIRRYPGIPNAYLSTTTVSTKDREIQVRKLRSGILAPFDMDQAPEHQDEKNTITMYNLAQMVAEGIKLIQAKGETGSNNEYTLLLQNLYSPNEIFGQTPLGKPDPQALIAMQAAVEMFRENVKTVAQRRAFYKDHGIKLDPKRAVPKIELLYSLKPVNSARASSTYLYKDSFVGVESKKSFDAIVKKAEQWLAKYPNHENADMIQAALKQYKTLSKQLDESTSGLISVMSEQFKDGLGILNYMNRTNIVSEMAAYEQILMDAIGIRLGSCISGKDREELVSVLVGALVETYATHQAFPTLSNDAQAIAIREAFNQNIANSYLTGHGMVLAGENAAGCNGIKNPLDILGKNVCDTICMQAQQLLGIDTDSFHPIKTVDKIGGLNKPKAKDPNAKGLVTKRNAALLTTAGALTALSGPAGLAQVPLYFANNLGLATLASRCFSTEQEKPAANAKKPSPKL